jgi:hypothetical protein
VLDGIDVGAIPLEDLRSKIVRDPSVVSFEVSAYTALKLDNCKPRRFVILRIGKEQPRPVCGTHR